jgi:hypothetical protein
MTRPSTRRSRSLPADWPDLFLPSTLGERTVRGWRLPPHLAALESFCMRLIDDPAVNRGVVALPLRHGKSWYCSHVLPAWYLLTRPHAKVILAGYEKGFVNEWAVKVRETIRRYGERLAGVRLGSIQRQDHFTLAAHGGELRTASPGSGVAGKGADLIIPDDLVKDMTEAANPARRHSLTTWVNAELLARLEPGGKVLAVMSRRHPDDQLGRWLAQNPELPPDERWHELSMPALRYGEGGTANALWPERYGVERLLKIKRRYELDGQSYLWDSLYQQDPRGDSTLIEWPETYWSDPARPGGWHIGYDELPPGLRLRWRVLSLDPSKGSNSKTGDYSAWSDARVDTKATLWVEPHLRLMPTEAVEDYTVELLARNRYDALVVECNGFQELIAENIVKKCRSKGVRCPMHKKSSTENKEVRIRLGLGPLFAQRGSGCGHAACPTGWPWRS